MNIKRHISILIAIIASSSASFSQKGPDDKLVVWAVVEGADTVPIVSLPEVSVYAPMSFKSEKEKKQYNKLVKNVKKVYPYAVLAGIKFKEYEATLSQMKNEVERKAYMKKAEKELKDQFEKDLKNLTLSQGRLLIKLIDRETGNSTYEVVKELRGSFSAFMWQTFAAMFGSSLKTEYDPTKGEDLLIEGIIHQINNGTI